ncbi:MAG: class I SAM-dependent methyltransferase [Gammaproteobacteria bacterium]
MRIVFLTLLAVVVAALIRKALRYSHLSPLLPRKYNFGKRGVTLRETLSLLTERRCKVLVETGVARNGLEKTKGDGASTVVFALWAKAYDAKLYTVDIDGGAIATANSTLERLRLDDCVELHTSDSVAFLESFEEQVDFLYLDSYDYHRTDTSIQQASQEHHLKEFKAIESRLHEGTFVLIDDCDLPAGGKGKLVIEYMLARGWKMHMLRYQALLTR